VVSSPLLSSRVSTVLWSLPAKWLPVAHDHTFTLKFPFDYPRLLLGKSARLRCRHGFTPRCGVLSWPDAAMSVGETLIFLFFLR
jgi:hypothetical protein